MLWSTIAPVLTAQVSACALEPSVATAAAPPWPGARWAEQQQTLVHPGLQVEVVLHIASVKRVGQDLWHDVSDVSGLSRTYMGQREARLNITVRSFDLRYPQWALEYAERIGTRLENRQSVAEALAVVNCGVIDVGETQNIGTVKFDNRVVSVASLDVRIRAAFTDETEALAWFDHLQFTSHFAPLGTPPNVVNLVIPEP